MEKNSGIVKKKVVLRFEGKIRLWMENNNNVRRSKLVWIELGLVIYSEVIDKVREFEGRFLFDGNFIED